MIDSNLIPATRGAQQTIQHQAIAAGTTAQLQIMEVLFAAIGKPPCKENIKQANYSLRRPPKLVTPQPVIEQ